MWYVVFYWQNEDGHEYLAHAFFDEFEEAVRFANKVNGRVESSHRPGTVLYSA